MRDIPEITIFTGKLRHKECGASHNYPELKYTHSLSNTESSGRLCKVQWLLGSRENSCFVATSFRSYVEL